MSNNCSCNLTNSGSSGNMYFRGEWEFCPEYKVGDVVLYGGILYMAKQHNAGKYPEVDTDYWKAITATSSSSTEEPKVADNGYSSPLSKNNTELRIRRDTTANWAENNPRLGIGELGIDMDLRRVKVGNGIDNWNNLPYLDDVFDDAIEAINESIDEQKDKIEQSSDKLKAFIDDVFWHIRKREVFLQNQIDILAEASIKASIAEIDPQSDSDMLIKRLRLFIDEDGDLAQR